jgi:hypothetical protein
VKLSALKRGASLDPALKVGICRRAGQKDVPFATAVAPAPAKGVFLADQMITSAVLNGKGRLPFRSPGGNDSASGRQKITLRRGWLNCNILSEHHFGNYYNFP